MDECPTCELNRTTKILLFTRSPLPTITNSFVKVIQHAHGMKTKNRREVVRQTYMYVKHKVQDYNYVQSIIHIQSCT